MKQDLIEKCDSYLLAQADHDDAPRRHPRPSVTISREAGAGAVEISELLANYLQLHEKDPHCPWAVFERNIVQKVLEDHRLPPRIESYMEESGTSMMSDTLENILGLHPAMPTLVQKTAETIFNLARRGNCIIVGRGSNIITAPLKNVLHVRLIAPLEQRIQRIERILQLGRKEAEVLVAKTDRARKRYVRQNFTVPVDEPLAYDLTINTSRMCFEDVATIIGAATCRLAEYLRSQQTGAIHSAGTF